VGAAVADVRLRAVADERLAVVVAAPLTLAGLEDVLLVHADDVRILVVAAARRIGAVLPRLALAGDEDEESE